MMTKKVIRICSKVLLSTGHQAVPLQSKIRSTPLA